MSDIVVTVPKGLWAEWLGEGDLAFAGATGKAIFAPTPWEQRMEYGFNLGGHRPMIRRAERVYIVAYGRVRGYAPLHLVEDDATRFGGRENQWSLVRRGGAVACTITEPVRGFQGWRYRWWAYEDEIPFPDWRTQNTPFDQLHA